MKFEQLESKDKPKNSVDLSEVKYNFCDDQVIDDYYEQSWSQVSDKNKWLEQNKDNLLINKDAINKAVEDGLIPDNSPETLWRYQADKINSGKERVTAVRQEVLDKLPMIKNLITNKLSKFLPQWNPEAVAINFTLNQRADFSIDRNEITIDLNRLSQEGNIVEKVSQGGAHELFHAWMSEKNDWSDADEDKKTGQEIKDQILFKVIDEGLAVLIGEQSLSQFHEKQGKDYEEYVQESFQEFNKFLNEENRENLIKFKDEEFKNMGHFYVVGNKIVNSVLQKVGMERFKKLIDDCRSKPELMYNEYKKLCDENPELYSING